MKTLLSLVGLVLIFEGLPHAAWPEAAQKWLRRLAEMEPEAMRGIGLFLMAAGLAICWLAQRSGLFE